MLTFFETFFRRIIGKKMATLTHKTAFCDKNGS
jgi:hypothetical protein